MCIEHCGTHHPYTRERILNDDGSPYLGRSHVIIPLKEHIVEEETEVLPILSNRWSLEIDGFRPESIVRVTNVVVGHHETTCKVHFYVSEKEDVESLVKKWAFKQARRAVTFKWVDRYSNAVRETSFDAIPDKEFTISDLDYAKSEPVVITLGLRLYRKAKR